VPSIVINNQLLENCPPLLCNSKFLFEGDEERTKNIVTQNVNVS